MIATNIKAGLYINTDTHKILRVTREMDIRERPGQWELLSEDINTGLLEARRLATAAGHADDEREVEWTRMYEGSLEHMETLDALDNAQRLADEADGLSTAGKLPFIERARRLVIQAPAGVVAAAAAATLLAAEMAG